MKDKTIELSNGIVLPIKRLSLQDAKEYGLLNAYTRQPEYKFRHLPGEQAQNLKTIKNLSSEELKLGREIRNVIAKELVASGWKVREIAAKLGYGYGFSSLRRANITNGRSPVCKRGHSRELHTVVVTSKSRNSTERICELCRLIWWRDAEKRRRGRKRVRRKRQRVGI